MPLRGGKYRVKTTKGGEKIRLHFTSGGKVNEAKNLDTGATHTPGEFTRDKKKGKLRKAVMGMNPMSSDHMMR